MRTAAICPTCATYENALCIIYNGAYLSNIDAVPLDSIEAILVKTNARVQILANKSIDGTFAANSDTLYPSQKAVKTYITTAVVDKVSKSGDTMTGALQIGEGLIEENNLLKVVGGIYSVAGTLAPNKFLVENILNGYNEITGTGNIETNQVEISGAEDITALKITATGNGIGLDVFNNGIGTALKANSNEGNHAELGGATGLTVTNSGRTLIGTGTDNTIDKLQVSGTANISGGISAEAFYTNNNGNYLNDVGLTIGTGGIDMTSSDAGDITVGNGRTISTNGTVSGSIVTATNLRAHNFETYPYSYEDLPEHSANIISNGGNIIARQALDVNYNLINGNIIGAQFRLSGLNTAPASATATGTLGEIRITAGFIYVCIATNTWVRAALTSWV